MSVPEPTEIETFTPHPDKAQDEEAVEETTSMELAVSIAVEAKGLETSTGDLPGPVTALENGAAYLEDTNELAEKDEKIEARSPPPPISLAMRHETTISTELNDGPEQLAERPSIIALEEPPAPHTSMALIPYAPFVFSFGSEIDAMDIDVKPSQSEKEGTLSFSKVEDDAMPRDGPTRIEDVFESHEDVRFGKLPVTSEAAFDINKLGNEKLEGPLETLQTVNKLEVPSARLIDDSGSQQIMLEPEAELALPNAFEENNLEEPLPAVPSREVSTAYSDYSEREETSVLVMQSEEQGETRVEEEAANSAKKDTTGVVDEQQIVGKKGQSVPESDQQQDEPPMPSQTADAASLEHLIEAASPDDVSRDQIEHSFPSSPKESVLKPAAFRDEPKDVQDNAKDDSEPKNALQMMEVDLDENAEEEEEKGNDQEGATKARESPPKDLHSNISVTHVSPTPENQSPLKARPARRPLLLAPKLTPAKPAIEQKETAEPVAINESDSSTPLATPPEPLTPPSSKRPLLQNTPITDAKKPRLFRSPISKPTTPLLSSTKAIQAPSSKPSDGDRPKGGPFLPPLSYLTRVARDECNLRAALLLGRIYEGIHDLNELALFPEETEEDSNEGGGNSSKPAPDSEKALKYYWIAAGEDNEEGVLGVGRLLLRSDGMVGARHGQTDEDEDDTETEAEKRDRAKRMLVELAEQRGNLEAMKLLAELNKAEEEAAGHGDASEEGFEAPLAGVSLRWLQETLLETGWDDDFDGAATGNASGNAGGVRLDADGVPPLPEPVDPSKETTTISPGQLLHLLKNPPDSAPLPRPLPRLKYLIQAYTEHRHLPSLMQALPALLAVSPELGLRYLDQEKRNDPSCCRYLARLLSLRYGNPIGSFGAYKLLVDLHGFAGDAECLDAICGALVRGGQIKKKNITLVAGKEDEEQEEEEDRQTKIERDVEAAKRYLFAGETPSSIRDKFADLLAAGDNSVGFSLPNGDAWELGKVEQDLETAVHLWDRIATQWSWWKAGCALEQAGSSLSTGSVELVERIRVLAFNFLHLAASAETSTESETDFSFTGSAQKGPSIREQACQRVAECFDSGFGVATCRAKAEEWRRVAKLLEQDRIESGN